MKDRINRKQAKQKLFLESVMVFFIAVSPFLYKLYDYVPGGTGTSITFLGITIGNHGFDDVSTFIWFMMSKIVPLYLLIFWFLTIKSWWYHIILIPIAMYAFQIFEVLYSNDNEIDTENLLWLLPICIIIIPLVYFIRIKIYDKHVLGIDLEAMDEELKKLKSQDLSDTTTTTYATSSNIDSEVEITSMSEELNTKLSTGNIENTLKVIQDRVQGWLHIKF